MRPGYFILAGLLLISVGFYFSGATGIASGFFVLALLICVLLALRLAHEADDDDEPGLHQ